MVDFPNFKNLENLIKNKIMKLLSLIISLFFTQICFSQVIINEIQSTNTSTLVDNFGEYEDWIEIYNPNDFAVEIGGLVLKDNVDTWQIPIGDPATLLKPKEYFILWADDEAIEGKFHTNFKLSAANGEFLGLYKQDSVTLIESVNFPPMLANQSYGKCEGGTWVIFAKSTPLKANDCSTSINNTAANENVLVYPTVTKGNVTIDLPNYTSGVVELYLFSIDGKLILNEQYNNKTFTVDLTNFPENVYILNIYTKEKLYVEKIIRM